MPLAVHTYRWAHQLDPGADVTFTIETGALRNVVAVLDPVFRMHVMAFTGAQDIEMKIEYVLTIGTSNDPLNQGIFRRDVVPGEVVSPGEFGFYDFGGVSLERDTELAGLVTHNVTLTNLGASSTITQSMLFGKTEVGGQYAAGQIVVAGNNTGFTP